jgi:glycine betaine/proline transport system permease protein
VSTLAPERPTQAPVPGQPVKAPWRPGRRDLVLIILALWIIGYLLLSGRSTFDDGQPSTATQDWFHSLRNSADNGRDTNPLFIYGFNYLRLGLDGMVPWISNALAYMGWLGVTVVFGAIGLVFANWKIALLAIAGFVGCGVLGVWQDTMDTLTLTLAAVVLSLIVGLALGVWAGTSDRFNAFVTPVLDFMQILPTVAYLPLVTLFFLIGPASATIATMIYAVPPVIRLTAAGIRGVSETTVEAATSMGSTKLQRLRQVQLPMAKKTIVLGVNQTTMAALSMVTIAALIGAPGLGETVLLAVEKLNVGVALNAGLAIVILAIVLDRMTTAVSERTEKLRRSGRVPSPARRWTLIGAAVAACAVAIYEGSTFLWASDFPEQWVHSIAKPINTASLWIETNLYTYTDWIKNTVTTWVIDPLQNLLVLSPWWLVVLAICALSLVLAGVRVAVISLICLGGIIGLGLWASAMHTLASVLVAAAIVMVLGTALGVWSGRSRKVEAGMRPFLDAGQVLPAFVYLPPCLALFGTTRFTGIVAAVIYAGPAVTKVVIEGIHAVPETTIEASISSGSSRWQVIRKVQLPMSRPHLLLAFNQGVIYVLAMVVVGALVGAEGLGLNVLDGFAQTERSGVALSAGIAIVLLGVMLDRITQGAGKRR